MSSATVILLIVLMALMVVALAAAVMLRSLLKSAIALAVASVILTVILFLLGSPWAAVFELSVCAGLITVVFISAISLTTAYSKAEQKREAKARARRFASLPFILVGAAVLSVIGLSGAGLVFDNNIELTSTFDSFRTLLWEARQADIFGQVILVLAGVFSIVVLFKESSKEPERAEGGDAS
ncbi:MAG: hypothetical protein FWD39_03110 [Clostridiales bacterium]|nr:hypothetical protein [Clostridiales bacterium]